MHALDKWIKDNNITLEDGFDLDKFNSILRFANFIKNEKDKIEKQSKKKEKGLCARRLCVK